MEAAVKTAEKALREVYGRKAVHAEEPFEARLEGNDWVVTGNEHRGLNSGKVVFGGAMTVDVSRSTGCVDALFFSK